MRSFRRIGRWFALLLLTVAAGSRSDELPAITFIPLQPTSAQQVIAVLPFEICAWHVVATSNRIDIDWIAAPCAVTSFTKYVDLGKLAPGTYGVYLNQSDGATPLEQAFGTITVATALVSPLPALSVYGLLVLSLGLLCFGSIAGRRSR